MADGGNLPNVCYSIEYDTSLARSAERGSRAQRDFDFGGGGDGAGHLSLP